MLLQRLEKDIVQANPLIEAQKNMTLTEMRLFGLALSDITPHIKDDHVHDVDFHDTWITFQELNSLFAKKNTGKVDYLKKAAKKAFDKSITIRNEDGSSEFIHVYDMMRYYDRKGLLIRFHDKMKPYILDLTRGYYTKYKLKLLFLLSSEHAQRILELLLEKQGYILKGETDKAFIDMTVEDFREKLSIPKDKYVGRIDNFKRKVIEEPIREINEKTEYFCWYKAKKAGCKVTGFSIWLRFKDDIKKPLNASSSPQPTPTAPVPPTPIPAEPVTAFPTLTQADTPADSSVPSSKMQLMKAMVDEGLTAASINTYFKRDGESEVQASFELAKEHADANEKTKIKGSEARKKYIKACLERGIAGINEEEKRVKKEIDEREKRLKIEKKKHEQELEEAFSQLTDNDFDLATNVGNIGNITNGDGQEQSELPVEKLQDLPDSTVETIIKIWATNGKNFTGMEEALKKYGHTPTSFYNRYVSKMAKLLGE